MTKKFEFCIATDNVGSDVTEIIEIEIPDDADEYTIINIVNEEYADWLSYANKGDWSEVKE